MTADAIKVPQLDLRAQYAAIREEIQAAIERVCESGHFILAGEGNALESKLAELCGASHAVGCASGSDALLLALVALGVKPGEEIITVPFTFFATAGAVARLGARATFVDINPRSYNLDPARLEAHLTGLSPERRARTRAVIVVHLYGQPAEMDAINEVAGRFDLPVVEDAAQALGAVYRGRPVGGLGRVACFSFYPTKNLGAYGDGGLVVTSDEMLADRMRALRQNGCTHDRYHHDFVGWNSRLDELQAAILRVKLGHLEEWTRARQERATRYDQFFFNANLVDTDKLYPDAQSPVGIPRRQEGARHVFHQYVIRAERRDELRHFLQQRGIETGVYYPVPLHLQACFADWSGAPGQFPESERAAGEVLALPLYPELTAEMQDAVGAQVAAFYGQR